MGFFQDGKVVLVISVNSQPQLGSSVGLGTHFSCRTICTDGFKGAVELLLKPKPLSRDGAECHC